jgi:hypothetical protein
VDCTLLGSGTGPGCGRRPAIGTGVSGQAGPCDRADRARRHGRHSRPPLCAEVRREDESAGRRREQDRGGRRHRGGLRRQVAGRRLHALYRIPRDERDPADVGSQVALQRGQGFRADPPHCQPAERAGGQFQGRGEVGQGAGRACPLEARRLELCLAGHRLERPCRGRAVPSPDQDRHRARPVQGRGTGVAGSHRGARADDVRHRAVRASAHPGRQRARSGRCRP